MSKASEAYWAHKAAEDREWERRQRRPKVDEHAQQLGIFSRILKKRAKYMLGYPLNLSGNLHYDEALLGFMDPGLNNIGDPFSCSTYGVNSFPHEQAVVWRLAELLHLPLHEVWGYVTASGSEGNWRGLSLGFRKYPDAVLYCSDKAHYSVFDAAEMMRVNPVVVPTNPDHSIDLNKLRMDLRYPAVFCLTAGTTMAGAVDDIRGLCHICDSIKMRHYIHVDAALSGFILPFVERVPAFDFRESINSLSVSGHKMLGTPFACGAFLTRAAHRPKGVVEYIGSNNATLFGSRNGLAPIAMWHGLRTIDLTQVVPACIERARYLLRKLAAVGWPAWMNDHCNTVMLRRPEDALVRKWQLAVEGEWAHVITMPHVGEAQLDEFVTDLEGSRNGKGKERVASHR